MAAILAHTITTITITAPGIPTISAHSMIITTLFTGHIIIAHIITLEAHFTGDIITHHTMATPVTIIALGIIHRLMTITEQKEPEGTEATPLA